MRRWVTMLGIALLASTTTGETSMASSLSDLRWESRVVILFASDESALNQQIGNFQEDERAMAERDMLVFAVVGDELRQVRGQLPSAETPVARRKRFGVSAAEEFTAVLIGKDGSEKWRGSAPVPHSEIDAIIDAMPMRRSGD